VFHFDFCVVLVVFLVLHWV